VRTMSAQPRRTPTDGGLFAAQEKQALCRTRSMLPTIGLVPTEVVQPQQQAPVFWTGHTPMLHPLQPPQLPPPPHSVGGWPAPVTTAMGPPRGLPDTSMPPPAPRSPWGPGHPPPPPSTGGDAANIHKKLARQLTLNPSYDPRIHAHRGSDGAIEVAKVGSAFPFPPPSTNVPPPQFGGGGGRPLLQPSGHVQQGHHAVVTRNASAPETAVLYPATLSGVMSPGAATANFQTPPWLSSLRPPQPVPQPPTSEALQLHHHLQRMSSTSDSQLLKNFSDGQQASSQTPPPPASAAWTESAGSSTEAAAATANSAVSPLIGSSDGVWETAAPASASASGGDRSKLYYHLAAVFPEDQVIKALSAMPEETNPQKICSYILSLSGKP